MATLLSSLETQARRHLLEPTANFWSSNELIDICNQGIRDLWRAINDLHQEHFLTNDSTNVSLAVDGTSLTGVPSDTYRVHLIEPRDLTDENSGQIRFFPRDYNDPDFQYFRSLDSQQVTDGLEILYCIINAGAPVGAPSILVAPSISTALNLRFVYVPVIAAKVATDSNPIPGESDQALICWMVAWARAKEREDRSPDPEWLALYATLKAGLLTSLTPRQDQEPEVVEPLFGDYWG